MSNMNKESSRSNSKPAKAKVEALNECSLKPFIKSISTRNKAIHSTNSNRKGDDEDNKKNKENEKVNSSRGKPPINRGNRCAPPLLHTMKRNKKSNKASQVNNRNKREGNTSRTLTAEITLSSTSITQHKDISKQMTRSRSLTNSSSGITKSSSWKKTQDEANDLKLINSKLQQEIEMLNERLTLLQEDVTSKTKENEQIKASYDAIVFNLHKEILQVKTTQCSLPQAPEPVPSLYENVINSLVSILLDICEIFISKNTTKISNTIQIENSVDVFESYTNDEDKRSSLLEQIQALLLAKMGFIKRTLNLSLNKEIERIQNWTSSMNQSISLNLFSPLKLKSAKANEDILNSLSKMYSNSNSTLNDFDLSVSGNFYAQSPKFNSFDNEGIGASRQDSSNSYGKVSNYMSSNQKMMQKSPRSQAEIVQMMSNDSLLDGINNEGNDKETTVRGRLDYEKDNRANEDDFKKEVNVLECSIGDLVSPGVSINAGGSLTLNQELRENMSNFTLDDVLNTEGIGGHS